MILLLYQIVIQFRQRLLTNIVQPVFIEIQISMVHRLLRLNGFLLYLLVLLTLHHNRVKWLCGLKRFVRSVLPCTSIFWLLFQTDWVPADLLLVLQKHFEIV